MDNKNIFADNLRHYMKVNNKTRRDICDDLGFSYYTFSDWVNGKKYPRMDKVEMLANYFGIAKSDLIEEKKKNKPINDTSYEFSAVFGVKSNYERWAKEVGTIIFNDSEMDLLIDYAKYLISKRK